MPPGISEGLRGSVGAKHSHETGLDTDLQALTRRYQAYAAGTEWYEMLCNAPGCHKSSCLTALALIFSLVLLQCWERNLRGELYLLQGSLRCRQGSAAALKQGKRHKQPLPSAAPRDSFPAVGEQRAEDYCVFLVMFIAKKCS